MLRWIEDTNQTKYPILVIGSEQQVGGAGVPLTSVRIYGTQPITRFHKSSYSEKVVMNKLIITALIALESFLLKGALAQIEVTALIAKKRIGPVSQDSSGWERVSAVGVRLTNRGDKILGGFQSSPISAKLVLRGDVTVADDSANGSTTSLSTATGASHLIAGRAGSGSYLPLKFWTNGSIRGTFATNGGFFMEGATGSSQGAGTINATGLYVNGVAVGSGGSPSGWTDGTNVVYVTDVNDSVGVGITSPTAKFHMHLRGTNQASSFKITTPLTGTNPLTDGFDVYYGSLGDHVYITNRETGNVYLRAPAGAVVLNTNGTDRVYVTDNGEIFIGMTSYDGITASGDVLADGGIVSVTGSTNASTMEIRAVNGMYSGLFADRSSAGGTYLPMAFFTNGSERARMLTTGAMLFGFTALDADNSVAGQLYAEGVSAMTSGVNGSTTGLYTLAGNYSGIFASRTSSGGTYLPMAFFTNGSRRATIATNGGFYMEGATGGSQGAGSINATGLYINGVAVGAGGATGWSYSSPVTYVSTPTDNVAIGSSTAYGKLSIKGDTDETQLWVRAHSTQTDTLVRFLTYTGSNILSLFNTGQLTLDGSSSWLSVPGGSLSEKFGKDAQATGTDCLALGYDARANTGSGNIAIGRGSRATNATGLSIAIGLSASATGNSATIVGYNSTSTANGATFFGSGNSGNFASTVIGYGGTTTAAGQFIGGSNSLATTDIYFGNGGGSGSTTGTSYTIHGSPAGSGQTNLAGGNLTITGGKGTGSGAGGDVIIQTATPGGSGTSQNAYVERMRIQDTGQIEHHNAVAMSIPSGATGPTEINSTGEIGVETNPLNGAFNFYNGSAEASISPVITKTWVVTSPTSSENFGAVNFPFAVTVDSIVCVLRGSSTPSVTINFAHGLDRSSGANLLTSGQAITNTTTGQRFGASSFSDATLAKGEFIWLTSSAQSGTVNELSVTMFLRKDAL